MKPRGDIKLKKKKHNEIEEEEEYVLEYS